MDHIPTRWSGQEVFETSRVGSGQVGWGRLRMFQVSQVGSGHDPRYTGHVTSRATLTRELFCSDAWVGPTYLTRGSNFENLLFPARAAL